MATAFDTIRLLLRFWQQRDFGTCALLIADILDGPDHAPDHGPLARLIAYCLRGEMRRGAEDFEAAERDYRAAIREGKALEAAGGTESEWYCAYRPRAQLGLITALRRQLWPDVPEMTELIAEAREEFIPLRDHPDWPVEDLDAQVDAVEGVLFRQLGTGEAAAERLTEAAAGIRRVSVPWFLFWHPEHVEAHRVLACVTTPGMGGQGRHFAELLLRRTDTDPWSRAAALAALLHAQLDDLTWEGADPDGVRAALKDRGLRGVPRLLERLAEEGAASGDPTLATEGPLLRAAWGAAAGAGAACLGQLGALAEREVDPNLALLRGVEAAVISERWLGGGARPPVVRELCDRGQDALEFIEERLLQYNYPPEHRDWCRALLEGGGRAAGNAYGLGWGEELLVGLRARLWP